MSNLRILVLDKMDGMLNLTSSDQVDRPEFEFLIFLSFSPMWLWTSYYVSMPQYSVKYLGKQ